MSGAQMLTNQFTFNKPKFLAFPQHIMQSRMITMADSLLKTMCFSFQTEVDKGKLLISSLSPDFFAR